MLNYFLFGFKVINESGKVSKAGKWDSFGFLVLGSWFLVFGYITKVLQMLCEESQ
jgi:hypothetical protein